LKRADAKIALLNHVGGGNLGDDATLDAVADAIKRRRPNAEIVAFSMNPDDTESRLGVKSYPIARRGWTIGYKPAGTETTFKATVKALTRRYGAVFNLLKAINAVIRVPSEVLHELSFLVSSRHIMKSLDLLIICGGGQLTGKGGPWGFPYTIFKWVVLARSARVSCVFLNVGAGPLTQSLSKFFVRRALLASDYVSLRDNKSQMLIHEIGFTGESQVRPDNVYGLDFATTKSNARARQSQSIVGLAPMPYPDPVVGRHSAEKDQIIYEAIIRKLAIFSSWLIDKSYTLTFFGTDIGVDPLAIEDLQTALLSQHGIPSSRYSANLCVKSTPDLLASMAEMDYVVTCRFHGVVFAHLLNKPVLAIAHHPKIVELMADLDLSTYCVDIRDFDPNLLAERFASMVIDAEEIKARMAASLERNRQELRSQFDVLFRCSDA